MDSFTDTEDRVQKPHANQNHRRSGSRIAENNAQWTANARYDAYDSRAKGQRTLTGGRCGATLPHHRRKPSDGLTHVAGTPSRCGLAPSRLAVHPSTPAPPGPHYRGRPERLSFYLMGRSKLESRQWRTSGRCDNASLVADRCRIDTKRTRLRWLLLRLLRDGVEVAKKCEQQ
ncbi:hypothetical protein GWI33_007295 [Rhynchophorus ferrugineus]|uniref:Uncharacterized protein n=1 Tax=Rhynchophorus ferrugineus TaxID=354439 RepID=A0A834IGG5_RHYFE|nr:hypothetical protein GWI33_007295 [Rhynchophorus ferrugineus]